MLYSIQYYHISTHHGVNFSGTFPKKQLIFVTGTWKLVSIKNIYSVYTKARFAIFNIAIYWYKFIKNYYILLVKLD